MEDPIIECISSISSESILDNSSPNKNLSSTYVDDIDPRNDSNSTVSSTLIIDKTPYTVVNEGKAEILFPSSHDVFYNPVQEFNRDMSIAVIKEFIKQDFWKENGCKRRNKSQVSTDKNVEGIHILEALAASGLRSVRYAKEISGVKEIVSNDMSAQAVESIRRNVNHNNVENIIRPSQQEAALLMYLHRSHEKRFQVVDLDPYGTPCPFLDSAVQCVQDGGLLIVTSTDTAVLCGNSSEKCRANYGAVSLKINCCHEMALRILLQSIEGHANRYGRYTVPVLSLSVDFYIRVFVQVWTSPLMVKKTNSKLAMVYQCVGCDTIHLQPLGKCIEKENGNAIYRVAEGPPVSQLCEICGSKHHVGGPIWQAEMHHKDFIISLIKSVEDELDKYKTGRRMLGMLTLVSEELPNSPLYYLLDKMCSVVHTTVPSSTKFRSAILNAGYHVSMSHAHTNSVKTDAPPSLLWDILRTWCKLNPKKKPPEKGCLAHTILNKESGIEVSFDLHPDATPSSRVKNLVRFQLNPEPFWGPKMRSKTSLWSDRPQQKQERHQGKRRRKNLQNQKQFNCKKYKEGACDKGDSCCYLHVNTKE